MADTDAPVISVVAGSPTEEELAAIVAVLTAATAAREPAGVPSDRPLAGGWKSYSRRLRRPHEPGPGAWQHSARP